MRATGPLTARDVELSVAGATKALTAELATLRADLTEARADVQRFEAALDAANRELAQARAERDDRTKWCMDVLGAQSCNRHTAVTLQEYVQAEIAAGCAQCARADLTEARSDVARFEAALDVANRELANELTERDAARAEAKRLQDLIERRRIADTDMVCYVCERPMRSDQAVTDQDIDNICPACASETIGTLNHASRTLRAGAEQADARYRAELAQARAERDEAMKQRDFAKDGEDNMRFLKGLWENECGFYRAQSVARLHEIDLGRRTIRALVVFGRAVWRSLRTLAGNQARWQMAQLAVKVNMLYVKEQSGQQAGE